MTPSALKKLAVIFWIILLCSVLLFLIFMLCESEIYVDFDGFSDLIKTAPNMERLRNIAENVLTLHQITNGGACGLCNLAMGAFLIFVIVAIIGLSQIRKMKEQLKLPPETVNRQPKKANKR